MFLNVVGEVNESFAIRTGRLLVPVVCLGAANTGAYNGAIRQNVRDAHFFIQLLGHSWGVESAEFEDLFDFALECQDDPALPMRHVALLLKQVDAAKIKTSAAQFREKLPHCPTIVPGAFARLDELQPQLTDLLLFWLSEI